MGRLLWVALMAVIAFAVQAEVRIGEMNTSFAECKAYSEQNGVPLVLIWSGVGCEYCQALHEALSEPVAKQRIKDLPYVFCHVAGESTARDFAATANGTKNTKAEGKLTQYPFVCAYWPDTVVNNFTGRSPSGGYMTADQFFAKVEAIVGDYSKSASFLVGNTVYDRLEAVPGKTKSVFVPLKDLQEKDRASYQIVAEFPRGGGQVTAVDQKVAIPAGVEFQAGDVVSLTLMKGDEVVDESAITFVNEPENGPANPYWIGEKAELEAGDWSMDIDAVKAAVKSGRANYAAVFFTGALWCPHCRGIEEFVFKTAEGRKWAKDNKVVFAVLDNPKRSADPNPTKPNGAPPTLLRYQAALSAVSFDKTLPSGAGYLSRKGIKIDEAEAVLQRNHTLGYPGGLYATPEAARTGYPTLIMLDAAAEKPMGRFARTEEKKSGVSDYWHDPVEHLQRLNDFLLLRDGEGELNGYASLTTLRHEVGCYNKGKATLQMNDRVRIYNLDGLEPGTLTIQASHSKSGLGVSIELLVAGASVAAGTDELVAKIRKSDIENGVQLRINAYPDTSVKLGESSVCTVNFTDEFEPSPVVDEATLPKGFSANVCLEEIEADGEVRSVSVKRTSGSLPSGLKLAYDKTNQSIVLTGSPSTILSKCVFTYTYTIVYNDRRTVTSEPAEVTVSTFDPSTLNPYLGYGQNRTIPIVSSERELVGTLTVTTTSRGTITAKYVGESKVSFRGNWTELVDDAAIAELSTKKGEKLVLRMDSDGLMAAVLTDVDGRDRIDGLSALLTNVDFDAFKGVYTVTLFDENRLGGHGYLTLKMTTSSQVKKGTVSYSGMLADGTSVSGSAQLSGAGFDDVEGLGQRECAELPIFKKTTKLDVRMILRIRCLGESTCWLEENGWAHVVHASDSAIPLVNGAVVSPYGVWFETGRKLSEWKDRYEHIGETFALKLGDTKVAQVNASGTRVILSEKLGTVSLSYAKNTGIISGKMKFAFDGETLNGTWKGVILPGWHYDCGCGGDDPALPFGVGTLYYSDKSSGKIVKRSLPVSLEIIDR